MNLGKLLLLLVLALACATAPKKKELSVYFSEPHPECSLSSRDFDLPFTQNVLQLLSQGATTTGSYVVTMLGLTSDVVVVSTGLFGTAMLCGKLCPPNDKIFGTYIKEMEKINFLWSTQRAYFSTEQWRCPYVDHIAQNIRLKSQCNLDHGAYLAAMEQINLLETHSLLNSCISEAERLEIQGLKSKISQLTP